MVLQRLLYLHHLNKPHDHLEYGRNSQAGLKKTGLGKKIFDENNYRLQSNEKEEMGCCSSNAIRPLSTVGGELSKDTAPRDPPITNKDADIIQSNWTIVEQDLQAYGLTLFKR